MKLRNKQDLLLVLMLLCSPFIFLDDSHFVDGDQYDSNIRLFIFGFRIK